jgi:hypothetical protein
LRKGLYSAPEGIDEELLEGEAPEIEIEVIDPEAVIIDADGSSRLRSYQTKGLDEMVEFDANLAEYT